MSDNKNINEIIIEDPSLILLVGVGSSGKTTFAKKHFLPTQIISSDVCRANICDSETDMRFLQPGFQLLNEILVKRLQAKKLSVIDATNTRLEDRQGYLKMACKYHIPTIAICSGLISKTAWLAFIGNNRLKLIDSKNPLRLDLIDRENLLAHID